MYTILDLSCVTQQKHQEAWPGCRFVINFGVIQVLFLLATQVVGHRDVKVSDLNEEKHVDDGWMWG